MQIYIPDLSFRAQRRIPTQTETEIPRFTRNDKVYGFTLVELAIALMVIGLLVGGVLKGQGQELIENARITKIIRDFSDIKTATRIFETSYNALPGDSRAFAGYFSNNLYANCADTDQNAYITGSKVKNCNLGVLLY